MSNAGPHRSNPTALRVDPHPAAGTFSPGRGARAVSKSHSFAFSPPGWAQRNGAPFEDWVLPSSLERVRRKLAGAEDGDRQMVGILSAVLADGLSPVEAACAEALQHGVHSADVILNILARRRDPVAPITIITPDALRLRHEPAADCARYDRLRRAG